MKHLFIINPAAGSCDRTESYTRQIEASCGKRGLDYRIEVSAAPGECARLAREAAQTGEEIRIYACGGDGTLNELASCAAGYPNAAVTVLPSPVLSSLSASAVYTPPGCTGLVLPCVGVASVVTVTPLTALSI